MENLLERAPFSWVLEDYGPKSLPIQVPTRLIGLRPELPQKLFLHFRVKIDKLPRRLVRVKKFRVRTNFSQTFDERRLARGNPARYSDGRHMLLYSTPARDEREQGTARPR